MNAKELKSVLTKIEKAKEKIATERDKLRELYDELETVSAMLLKEAGAEVIGILIKY